MTTYVVCDIEADGPIPGPHSMISLGAVAFNKKQQKLKNKKQILGEFEINIYPLENAKPHPTTIKWFKTHASEALEYTKKNQILPKEAMKRFGDWLLTLPSPRVMAAHPAAFDFMWINWYMQTFLSEYIERVPFLTPFFDKQGFTALDIKSYAAAILKKDFRNINNDNYSLELYHKSQHSHKALDDARAYSKLLIKLLNKI
jgi:DNA polymerase III epsilon subunit-like protein